MDCKAKHVCVATETDRVDEAGGKPSPARAAHARIERLLYGRERTELERLEAAEASLALKLERVRQRLGQLQALAT
jgi:hypothetical protein